MNDTELHHLLGAYLLGGLEAADSVRFEAHLKECATCPAELAELASLPALLDALPVPDAVALTVSRPHDSEPAEAVSRVPQPMLDEVASRRRKSRRRWAAAVGAVAAACLALGFVAGPLLNRPAPPDASYSVVSGSGLQLSVDLIRKAWGTELAVDGRRMPLNGTLSLWVKDRDGGEERSSMWTATPSGNAQVTGATPVQLGSIASVELRDERQQTVAVISLPTS